MIDPKPAKGKNAATQSAAQGAAALIAIAREALEKGDTASAARAADAALSAADCTPDVRMEAGNIFSAAGDTARAVAVYVEAGLTFLYDAGDMSKARAAYAQAHQLDPSNLDVIFQMGQADVVEGRTQDALAKFIDVLRKSNLKHVPALFEAGCIYQSNAQYDQAILAFKKVLDRDKNHVQAIVHMGQLHQTKGMVPEALAYYMQAAEIARESKQFGTAGQLLNMVLALDGANQKARIMLDDLAENVREEEASAALPPQAPAAELESKLPPPAAAPSAVERPAAATPAPPVAPAPAISPEMAKSMADTIKQVAELAAQRDELQRQIDEMSSSRMDIELAVARATDETEAAVAARDRALEARAKAEHEAATLAQTIAAHKESIARAEARKAQVETELASASSAIQEAKKVESHSAASAEKRRAELEIALSELAEKRTAAEASASQASAAATEAAAAKAKAEKESAASRERLKAELETLAAQRGEADTAAQTAKAASAAAAAECAKLEAEAGRLREKSAAQAKSAAVDEEAAKRAATALAELQKSIKSLEERQAKAHDQADEATTQRDKLRAEIAAAEASLKELRERVKSATANASDAEKLKKTSAHAKEMESAAAAAAARLAEAQWTFSALEARKREIDDAYANSKSLAAAAEERRAQAAAAAEQAETLRAKREADAEALAARMAASEQSLAALDARAKVMEGESAALAQVTEKVGSQRKALLDLEAKKVEVEAQAHAAEQSLNALREETARERSALEQAKAAAALVPDPAPASAHSEGSLAEVVFASVPPQTCDESLRTIESLGGEGEIPFEIAAELAGLIHEGRAVEALRVARARANLEAKPAAYLLVAGDLSRDLGDATGARDAYRMLAVADPRKSAVARERAGQLFLTFADQSTAAALQRDDAHFIAAQEPSKALEAYADLVARFPNDPFFRQELGEIHERLGNPLAAGLSYSQAVSEYLGLDDFSKAVELAPKLLGVRPDDGASLELAARAYERAGKAAQAQAHLDQALHSYRRATSAADVERVCRRLADIADDPVPYRRELASLLAEVGDDAGAAEQLLEGAERLLKWSNAADALVLIKEAAALAGDAAPLGERIAAIKDRAAEAQRSTDQATRAAMFLSKQEFQKAADAYRGAVDKNPYNADACYQLACLLTDHFPDYATAEQLLENAAELRPGHTATRYRLALVKAAKGDVEQAVELLVALARFDESNADFIDQFVERLERDADGGAPAAKYRLGIAYRELGRLEEALVILQSIQRESEYVVLCLNAIGLCLRRQGLDTAAAKRFQKAIETPGYPEVQYNEALYNLGDLYEAKREPESLALALSSYEELYARDCTYRDVTDRIKSVKTKLGAAEGPKVKRLPNRSEAAGDR